MDELKVSQVTTTVKVVDVVTGEPPAIVTIKRAVNPSGIARHFTLKTPVPDKDLFQRLLTEVSKGDEIQATIVNEWHESGRLSYLADFSIVRPDEERGPAVPALSAIA